MDDDDDRAPKKYTLVRDTNEDLYLVAKYEATPIVDVGDQEEQQFIQQRLQELQIAQNNLDRAVQGPLGSGVRIKVPKILD